MVRALGDKHTHFLNIWEEARLALAAGRVPHGAVAYVKWWYGETQFHETHGLVSLNSNFRAALQKTVKMHHQRFKQYRNVIDRLVEYRSHVDRRRRDLGYESPHHDG